MNSADFSPRRQRRSRLGLIVLCWLVFAAWPLIVPNDYLLSLGVAFFINVLLLASLNLITGFAGQISLCHAGFFGLGAYISGVLATRYGLAPALGLICAMIGAGGSAWLIGLPVLRLRGHYLAMATLGFNAILSVLFVELVGLTGGPNGLNAIPPITLGSFALDSAGRFFWLAWLLAAIVMAVLAALLASRAGRALRAVSGSEVAAQSMGIDPFAVKLGAFVLSGAIAALAGALYAHFNQYASPETFSFSTSVLLLVMVALGGWGHYWGPIYGALIYTAMPELLQRFQDAELFVFGACMIVVLLYLPGGVAGAVQALGERRMRRRQVGVPVVPAEPVVGVPPVRAQSGEAGNGVA